MELIAKKIFFTLSKMRLSFSMRKSNVMTHFYQLLRKIGRTRGSDGRAHGYRWSWALFSWAGVQRDKSNVYILYFDDEIRAKTFLEKINNVPVIVSIFFFFQIFGNDMFCQIFTPPLLEPTHHIREFLSYGANSFCSS